MPRPLQEAAATRSRRVEPRPWLRVVGCLLGAGLHPRANATTAAVAADLARRMDYRRGLVLYDLDGTAARLDVSRATVKRHVRVLRELGALAWWRHGSRANLHLPGRKYAGTATVYAAVIPPVFDEAMGNRLSGTGYDARVVGVTQAGRERAVRAARAARDARTAAARPVTNSAAGSTSSQGREPHSRSTHPSIRRDQLGGGLKDTAHARRRTTPPLTTPSRPRRSPVQVARDIAVARRVRPLVGWTQHEGLRRLAFAFRPLIDRGLDAHDIAAELTSWWLGWRPARPAAFITAELRRRTHRRPPAAPTEPNEAFRQARTELAQQIASNGYATVHGENDTIDVEQLTHEEVIDLRSAAAADPGLVLAAIENMGEPAARRLYTDQFVDTALMKEYSSGSNMIINC